MITLPELEQRYAAGIELLKKEGYYQQTVAEIHYLTKYMDSQWLIQLFSDNLFSDIQGVFLIFVREDLKELYQELEKEPKTSLEKYFKLESNNLLVLRKCATSLVYQVKSIVRMPQVRNLTFKSRYLEALSRKLSGEIQKYYKVLVEQYKEYFRKTFSREEGKQTVVSLGCLRVLSQDYDFHFLTVTQRFVDLSSAINFVRDLFAMQLESRVTDQLAPFFRHQDKMNRLIDYFINDLKRSFIQSLNKQFRQGREYIWIRTALEEFIHSERFGRLLRKVIYQTMSILQKNYTSV